MDKKLRKWLRQQGCEVKVGAGNTTVVTSPAGVKRTLGFNKKGRSSAATAQATRAIRELGLPDPPPGALS